MFDLTDTQTMLRDSLSRFLAERYSFEARGRALVEATSAPPAAMWRSLATELGIVGAAFDEAQGGLGGGLAEHLVIMETLGESLAAETYLSTAVIGGGLLKAAASEGASAFASELVGRIVDGDVVIAFAQAEPQSRWDLADVQTTLSASDGGTNRAVTAGGASAANGTLRLDGRKAVVLGAPWATHYLVTARSHGARHDRDGLSLVIVPAGAAGIERRDYPSLDGGRASELRFTDVAVERDALIGIEGRAIDAIEHAVDEATLAVCAEAVGVMRRMLADTIAYSRDRRQFGVPIASFQVLQHRMVDMYMALEQADAATFAALERFDSASAGNVDGAASAGARPAKADALTVEARRRAVSSAKVTVGKACRVVGQGAVQIHGGMGMTEELAISHYFRRTISIEQQFGSVTHHLLRCESLRARSDAEAGGVTGITHEKVDLTEPAGTR
ncbi:MAG: pimeloyl-CoA dehydrogenase small subunit [Rhizobacter sp.]|nr:pimeloyl-CoA dehydrogenase small subunit [Rhizobacter sp.]